MTRKLLVVTVANRDAANAAVGGVGFGLDCFVRALILTSDADTASASAFVCDWDATDAAWSIIDSALDGLLSESDQSEIVRDVDRNKDSILAMWGYRFRPDDIDLNMSEG